MPVQNGRGQAYKKKMPLKQKAARVLLKLLGQTPPQPQRKPVNRHAAPPETRPGDSRREAQREAPKRQDSLPRQNAPRQQNVPQRQNASPHSRHEQPAHGGPPSQRSSASSALPPRKQSQPPRGTRAAPPGRNPHAPAVLRQKRGNATMAARAKKRRKRRMAIQVTLAAVLFCGLMTVLSLTVMFRISNIVVTQSDSVSYTKDQIANASGIEMGEVNLFRCNPEAVARRLEENLPYIGEAAVKRKFPSTLEIIVSPTAAAAALDYSTGYLLIDRDGKMLELIERMPVSVMVLKCPTNFEMKTGGYIEFDDSQNKGIDMLEIYKKIVNAVESTGLQDITLADIREPRGIKLMYQNRLSLYIGSDLHIEQKLQTAVKTLEEEDDGSRSKTGTIDLSKLGVAYVSDGVPETTDVT